MKLTVLFENQDYGSRFIDQRDLVRNLKTKLENLKAELVIAAQPADFRDFESDKDRSGGNKFIKRAIAKVKHQLNVEQLKLKELNKLWDSVRSKVGE